MAEYIEDTGSNSHDAELTGTYTTDAPNKTLTMGADGQADTGFILPSSSEWLLIETYDVENVTGDIGYHWWKSNVADVNASLLAFRNIVDAEYTLYKMKGTHYLGNGKADVYEANNTTAFPTTADNEDVDYTPLGTNWLITDTLIAPEDGQLYSAEIQVVSTYVEGSSALTNFPVSITEASLTGGGVDASLFANCRSDGGDIRFYSDASGTTQIAHELVDIDTTGETVEIHVKVPSVATASNTSIYMRYGNSSLTLEAVDSTYGRNAVWSQFDRVFHFNQDPSTTDLLDSTGSDIGGSPDTHNNAWVTGDLVDGVFKKGWAFNTTDDRYVNIGTHAQLPFTRSSTLYVTCIEHMIFNADRKVMLAKADGTNGSSVLTMIYDESPYFTTGGTSVTVATNYPTDSDIFYNARSNGTTQYISTTNSDVVSGAIGTADESTTDVLLGGYWTTDSMVGTQWHQNGTISEFRFSTTTSFTEDWSYTERNNLSAPDTFFSSQTPTAL